MRLWLKWESLDIAAMLEAIEMKSELESRRFSINLRKQQKQKELDKLKSGKSSMKTMFKSQNSIVNSITNLTREIASSEKEIECYDIYIKTLVIQINHAAIPYFKKDKIGLYNDLINTYSESYINNSQLVSQCFARIMELNQQINTEQIVDEQPTTKVVSPIE